MAFEDLRFRFVVDKPGFDPETFQVVDFTGEERISRPFRFDVNLVSYEPALVLSDVARQPATLEVYRGDEQLIFHGEVIHFEQGVHVADRFGYRAVLGPALWYLSLSFQSYIFRLITVPEVVEDMLKEAGFAPAQYRFELSESYPQREYCVQYNETDLNFIQRLLEHEGIRYFFDEGTLVFTDEASASSPTIPGNVTLRYNPGGGLEAAAEAVREFICREQLVTGRVLLKDYNYRTPETLLEAESQLNGEMPGLHYEYGQHFKDVGEGSRLAQVRNEEIECQRRVMRGESGYVGLRAGHLFPMAEHFRQDLNGDYLLTSLRHEGQQQAAVPGLMGGGSQPPAYRNHFHCIPAEVMYRPPRLTPVPRIPGIMTGRIEKPGGDYAHLDEEGRYRARMHFDRGIAWTAEATHPIRMKQPYTGPGYGIHFPNHAETEMVWACIDGNPDRPMALGTGPNPTQQSPSTSSNKWQSVIRTWGRNELTFDDKVGEENIYMHATKDHTVRVTNNQRITVGSNRTKSVGHDETNTIKNDRTTTIQEGNDALTVTQGKRDVTVKQDQTFTIEQGNFIVSVQTGSATMNFKQNRTVNVQTGNDAHNVKGTFDTKSEGAMNIESLSKITISSASEIEIKVGGSSIKITGGSIEIKSPMINSEATAINQIKGPMINSEASGINNIKGGLVTINP